MKRIVIFSATEGEIATTKAIWHNTPQVDFVTCGVGILESSFHITNFLAAKKTDIAIMAGIAGTYSNQLELGDVVLVKSEILGNNGVKENGDWKDLSDMGFRPANEFPFTEKALENPFAEKLNFLDLQLVRSNTVEEITTDKQRIELYEQKYTVDIESMEGASFHYACIQQSVPFLQIRSISNLVGERDKSKWNFKDAIGNLNIVLQKTLENIVNEN